MENSEALTPSSRFDAVPLGREALPAGVFASDAAKSAIPEIRALFDPGSKRFGGFHDHARLGTRQRRIKELMDKLELKAANGDQTAADRLDEMHAGVIDIDLPAEPDTDLYEEAQRKREETVEKLKGHAEVSPISHTSGKATFIAITPDGKCIYGIGPEDTVFNWRLHC